MTFGGVSVLEVKLQVWEDNGKVLIYTHGGAFTIYSARSILNTAALTVQATGYRVLFIDYILAPHAEWEDISDEIIAVFSDLLKEVYNMEDMSFFGDSAGGGLAITSP